MTAALPLPPRKGPGAWRQHRLALTDARRGMIAKIHVARKDLALSEDAYRDLLARLTTQNSASLCSDRQLEEVLAEFRRLGWTAKPGRKPISGKPNVRMIHGLWKDLTPFLSDASPAALRAFVARQTKTRATPEGVSAPEFLDGPQANRVIEGLKSWLARERARVGKAKGAKR